MAQRELGGNAEIEAGAEVNEVDELPPGTELLHGQYTITRFLNNGGFGITYLARDSLDRKVVIKECFPGAFCRRTKTTVSARSRACQGELKSIIRLFVQEARSLSRLVHPNIVGVHQVFQDNETAYMAIDFIDGKDLLDVVDDPDFVLTQGQIVAITRKILSAIGFVHRHGVLHRDISPDNILLGRDGEPILIDFGAAREHASGTNRALSALRVVKDGYSPQEFYIAGGEQGAWSDLYALAASLYHVIKGIAPVNGQARLAALAESRPDPCEPLAGNVQGFPPNFLEAIDRAMKILPGERLQSAGEWLDMLDMPDMPDGNGDADADTAIDGNPEMAIARLLEEEAELQARLARNSERKQATAPLEPAEAPGEAQVEAQAGPWAEPDTAPAPRRKGGLMRAASVIAAAGIAGFGYLRGGNGAISPVAGQEQTPPDTAPDTAPEAQTDQSGSAREERQETNP